MDDLYSSHTFSLVAIFYDHNYEGNYILIALLIATASTAIGQQSELKMAQIQAIQKLINTFKTNNNTKIADLISYPLRRRYPLKDVKYKIDFTQRFEEIIDKGFIELVVKSKISDWSEVDWQGIMLDNGKLWIDDDGKL